MPTPSHPKLIHRLFDVSVIAKGVDGLLQIAGGVVLFAVDPQHLRRFTLVLTRHELAEDPHDPLASYLARSAAHLSVGSEHFGAIYLLWHGLIKVVLVAALLLRQRWAYPTAIVAFVVFVVYQLYRYSFTHAPGLIVLSVLDIVVIALTWLEYRRLGVAALTDRASSADM